MKNTRATDAPVYIATTKPIVRPLSAA